MDNERGEGLAREEGLPRGETTKQKRTRWEQGGMIPLQTTNRNCDSPPNQTEIEQRMHKGKRNIV